MIELKLKKTVVRLDFSFFAVITLFLFLDNSGFGIASLAACGSHEISHLIIMTVFGIPAEQITFYGAGIRVSSPQTENARPLEKALILLGGCAANFIAAVAFGVSGNHAAAAINLFTGIFNLLPMGELDGAGLLKMLLIAVCAPENVDKAMRAAGFVSAAVIAAAILLLGGGVSFTLMTTLLYIVIVGSGNI